MKKYYIKTFGCQQNESDSERIATALEKRAYKKTDELEQADLIVVNACSVRQSAVDRIFGFKQKFKKLKTLNREPRTILTGCVLKSDKKKFKEFFDEVVSVEEFLGRNYFFALKPKCKLTKSALVPIMTGCNNFCSYCVVPYTRGREVSRPIKEIIAEVKGIIKRGYKEIILLGQNVNSYKSENKTSGSGFAKLLEKINSLSGDFIIKFLTNHPKDMSDQLIEVIARCDKVAKEIHLPIQSGDNTILKKMNRGYTVEQYKKLVEKIKNKIPNIKISTDVIVGFPGETKKQFENTVKLFKEINYDSAYINKYSSRAGTAAAKLQDNVSWAEKKKRWDILNEIVNYKPKIVVVLGPTASGKSDLAVKLSKKYNGEIISADSRQIYKGMDIGTGKITKKEMKGVSHHLLDVASPKRQFSVAQYKKRALKAIDKIYKKGKIPIVCGGTGFYIQAVIDGLIIPAVKPDYKLRKELEKETTKKLYSKLKKLDSARAKTIDKYNRRRLIRALEIILKTGKPVPKLKTQSSFNALMIGIKKPREELRKLIKNRLINRFKRGMISEVEKLRKAGLSWKKLEDFGLEYRYIALYLQGKLDRKKMIENLEKEILNYAKRQMTWSKRDKRIHWIKNYQEAEKLVKNFLK